MFPLIYDHQKHVHGTVMTIEIVAATVRDNGKISLTFWERKRLPEKDDEYEPNVLDH